eukprot:jgi/Chrpa1/331/Chrysochromulina_OHIO_Genome00004768-RA
MVVQPRRAHAQRSSGTSRTRLSGATKSSCAMPRDGGAVAPGARPAQQRHVAHEALGRDEEQLRRARGIAHRHVRPHAKEQMLHGRRLARKRGCDRGVNNASFRADTLFNVEDDLRDGQHL